MTLCREQQPKAKCYANVVSNDDFDVKPAMSVSKQRFETMKYNVRSIDAGSGSLDNQKKAMSGLLKTIAATCPVSAKLLVKLNNCSSARRCNQPICAHCSNSKSRQGNRHNKHHEHLKFGYCNNRGTTKGEYSSNYQVRNGQKMTEPFDGLPLCFLHPATVDLGVVPVDINLKNTVIEYKQRLRRCFKRMNKGAIVRGYLDFKIMYMDKAKFDIPNNRKEAPYHTTSEHKLHAHFIVFDPQGGHESVRGVLTDEFPGNNRVCVRRPFEDIQLPSGQVVRGLAGYAEYASLGKIELNFGKENGKALHEYILLNDTWDGRTKRIAYGTRSSDTESYFDQTILDKHHRELEQRSSRNYLFRSKHMMQSYETHHCSVSFGNTIGDTNAVISGCKTLISSSVCDLTKTDWYRSSYADFITSICRQYLIPLSNSSLKMKAVHAENTGFFNEAKSYIHEKTENLAPP